MPCPKCGSHDLWDDLMWWGCNICGWFGQAQNRLSRLDRFGPVTYQQPKKDET